MVQMEGFMGSKRVTTTLGEKTIRMVSGERVVVDESLWVVCFQRVSKRLKTCDAVFITGSGCFVQTTPQPSEGLLGQVQACVSCPVYVMGLDPLPWKRLTKQALSEHWTAEDWQHLLAAEDTVSEDSSDEDYVPDDSSGSESDD
jgi:hypothetical protein